MRELVKPGGGGECVMNMQCALMELEMGAIRCRCWIDGVACDLHSAITSLVHLFEVIEIRVGGKLVDEWQHVAHLVII
jgi:hypothetical protein